MCCEISLDDLEGNNKHQRAEKKKKRTRIKKHLICLRACILWPACLCNSSYSPSKPYVLAHVVRLLILYSLDSRPAELSFSLFLFFPLSFISLVIRASYGNFFVLNFLLLFSSLLAFIADISSAWARFAVRSITHRSSRLRATRELQRIF